MSLFDRAHDLLLTFYSNYMAHIYRVISEIFNVEKYRDIEIRVRGHSRLLKVVPFDRLPMVSY